MYRIPSNARASWTRIFRLAGMSALAAYACLDPEIEVNVYLRVIHGDDWHTKAIFER